MFTVPDMGVGGTKNNRAPQSRRGALTRSRWFLPGLVFCAALGIRLAVGWGTRDLPFVLEPLGDAKSYYLWARQIREGDVIGSTPFYQAPLYPYVLAALMWVAGDSPQTLRTVQAIWGACGVAMLAIATARMFGRRAGWAAGLMMAFYPPACFFDLILQKATLDGLLISAWLIVMSACGAWATFRRVFLAGVLLGLIALTRENALVWAPVAALWLLPSRLQRIGNLHLVQAVTLDQNRRRSHQGWLLASALLLGTAMPLGIVAWRNWIVSGEWSPTTFQAGPNFYIGNSAWADGRYRPLVRGHETPEFERDDAVRLAQEEEGRILSAGEVSRYWMRRAWMDIAASPGRWMRLMGVKLLMAVNAYEVGDVESLTVYAVHVPPFGRLTMIWHFGVLLPLAGAGYLLTCRRRRAGSLLLILIVVMIPAIAAFYILARYRYPLVPLLMPLAATGIVRSIEHLVRRRWRTLFWPWLTAGTLAVLSNAIRVHPERPLDAMALSNLGVAYARQGQMEPAEQCFLVALSWNPDSAETRFNLGMVYAQTRKTEEAIMQLRRASALAPGMIEVDYLLGTLLEQVGHFSEAAEAYRRANRFHPADARALQALQRLESRVSPHP